MGGYQYLIDTYNVAIEKNLKKAQELSLHLAKNPEVSGEEKNSSKAHIDYLKSVGLEVTENFCDIEYSYFANVVKKEHAKYTMAIISEYDALPGVGHACGHCASGAISLLTAATFKEMSDDIDVNIDIIGTPNEELDAYKVPMVEKGIFSKYDFAMMVHLGGGISTANYKIISLTTFRVTFKGISSHAAASPFDGKNALDAATIVMLSCGLLRQQLRPGTIMSYYIVNGGVASNSIPDCVELEFCLRHDKVAYLQEVKSKVTNCIKGAALSTGTSYEINYIGYECSDMPYLQSGTDIVSEVFNELDIENKPVLPVTISTDMGNVGHACPSMHPILSVTKKPIPLHSIEMAEEMQKPTINTTIHTGSKLLGHTFIKFISDKSNFASVKEDFHKAIQEKNKF